jgi:uncharacterized protein YdiU (UPF0061 family)
LEFVSVGQCSLSSDSGSSKYLEMMQNKLGLFSLKEDRQLIQMLTENLQLTETDMTSGN